MTNDQIAIAAHNHVAAGARIADRLARNEAARIAALVMESRVALQSGAVDSIQDRSGVFAALVQHFAPQGLGAPGNARNNRLAWVYQTLAARAQG